MKRFIVPLFVVLVGSSCGNSLDGSWSTVELRDSDTAAYKYSLQFFGSELTVKTSCIFGPSYSQHTQHARGTGTFKRVDQAFVVSQPIEVKDDWSGDDCDWTFKAQTYAYELSNDHMAMRVYFSDDSYLDFYRD